MNQDEEDMQTMTEGQVLADFTRSAAWGHIRTMFNNYVLDLQSVMNIDRKSPQDMATEVYARQLATDYLMQLIKNVEGRAQQHEANQSLTRDPVIQQI